MATRRSEGSLPADLSSFVGRRQELSEVRHLLGEARLVTLTGTGGVGKTRLAVRVARTARRAFHDGAWLVELAAVTDPGQVAVAVAETLRIPEQSGRAPEDALATFLARRDLLLVVDNCEHVVETCAPLLSRLLQRAEGLRVLATSREVLGVQGEAVYPVAPLGVPEGDGSLHEVASPALELLVERAGAASPGFVVTEANLSTLAGICRRLDGLPLAIELAAARLRVLSPQQLAERLDDRFRLLAEPISRSGRRTLRQTVEWSFDLCDKAERKVWTRMAVFAGDVELAAAEVVCASEDLDEAEVTEAVAGLVNKSVLLPAVDEGGPRFRMLATLREYGLERLRDERGIGGDPSPAEVDLRARHLAWYAELAARLEREWFGPDQPGWRARLMAELPNIRTALQFALDNPEHRRAGQQLAADLRAFWITGPMREGTGWLSRLVEAAPEPSRELVHALSALSWVAAAAGAADQSTVAARSAVELAADHAPERVTRALHNLGMNLASRGDPSALPLLEESVARARKEPGHSGEEQAYALFALGFCVGVLGDAARSADLYAQSVSICRRAGERWWLAWMRTAEALPASMLADPAPLESAVAEALHLARQIPDHHACVVGLSHLALREGADARRAAFLLGICERYWRDAGGFMLVSEPWASAISRAEQRWRTALGESAYDEAHRRGESATLEEGIAMVLGERQPAASLPTAGAAATGARLTRREAEIARLVAEGLTNRDIAAALVLSARTVETHVQNILIKTGFTSRTQVAAWYPRMGGALEVPPPEPGPPGIR